MSERPKPIEITDPVTIDVDGTPVVVQRGDLLIDACERAGTYIPRFCYHPRMSPVGMCRMCLVEVDTGRGPSLQPSCMLECTPDMKVDTESDLVKKVQEGVLEYLLLNHPLDCPVCDKGGECPLQDQTMSHGPSESRWVEEKRHYAKPISISETIFLDRERCIICDRCTRFASEVAGDPLIHFMDRGAGTQINIFPDEPFTSYFSGNTVQVCPVGALTAKPYRFVARPWDLSEIPSTCTGCSVGCRISVQSTRNEVVRYRGVDSDPVNWGWLCDKGRFGFESVGHEDRLSEPLVRDGDTLGGARWNDALELVASALRAAAPTKVAIVGGSRLTNESAWAWARLGRDIVGTANLDAQLGDGLPAEVVLGTPRATIDDVCAAGGTVIVLSGDVREELPVLFLRLKHAAVNDGVRIIEITPVTTGLSRYATVSLRHRPAEAAAVAAALATGSTDAVAGVPAEAMEAAVSALADRTVTAVVGRPSLSESSAVVVDAVAALLRIDGLRILPALRRANVMGALAAGLRPAEGGLDTAGSLRAAADGRIDVLVLLGADPIADFPDRALAERALAGARTVVAVDNFLTESSRFADVVLPAASFAEVDGTTTNIEGRISPVAAKVTVMGSARPDWMIASDLAELLDSPIDAATSVDAIAATIHDRSTLDALEADDDASGVLVAATGESFIAPAATPLPATDAYGARLVVPRRLYDQGTLLQHCPSSAGIASEAALRVNPTDASAAGITAGSRVRVSADDRTLDLTAAIDDGVPRGSVVIPFHLDGGDPTKLIDADAVFCQVRLEVDS